MLTKIGYFYILFIILEQFITLKIRSSKEHQQNLNCCSLSLDTIIIFYYYYCLFIYYYFHYYYYCLFVYCFLFCFVFFALATSFCSSLNFLNLLVPSQLSGNLAVADPDGAQETRAPSLIKKKMIDCIC